MILEVLGILLAIATVSARSILVSFRLKRRKELREKEEQETIAFKMQKTRERDYSIRDLVMWEVGDEISIKLNYSIKIGNEQIYHDKRERGYFWRALSPTKVVLVYSSKMPLMRSRSAEEQLKEFAEEEPSRIKVVDVGYREGAVYINQDITNEGLDRRRHKEKIFSQIGDGEYQKVLDEVREYVKGQIEASDGIQFVVFDKELKNGSV